MLPTLKCTLVQNAVYTSIFQTQRQCIFFWNGFMVCQGRVRHRHGFYLMFVLSWLYFFSFFPFWYLRKCTPASPCSLDSFYLPFYLPFFLFLFPWYDVSSFFWSCPWKGNVWRWKPARVSIFDVLYSMMKKRWGGGHWLRVPNFCVPLWASGFSVLRFLSIWNLFFQVAAHCVLFLQSNYGRLSAGQVNDRTEKHVEIFGSRSCTLAWFGVPPRKIFPFISDMS